MNPEDVYGDFYHKIHQLLETPDAELVPSGLADLAAGKYAIVQDELIAALQSAIGPVLSGCHDQATSVECTQISYPAGIQCHPPVVSNGRTRRCQRGGGVKQTVRQLFPQGRYQLDLLTIGIN